LAKAPRITVLHVVDVAALTQPAFLSPSVAIRYGEVMRREIRKSLTTADRLVARVADRLRKRWPQVRTLVARGYVADKIIAQAQQENAELILIGSRGLSNIKGFLLGSVSQKVVTHAPCSVLVVKRKGATMKRFLLAVDGSRPSTAAMQFLISHVAPHRVRGTALYVWDYPLQPRPESLPLQMIEERYCRPLASAGFKATPRLVMGHSAAMIVKVARRERPDLVVVGSRGMTGPKRLLLGGVSHKVVKYSQSSVLVVR
jgi:nucleotide-binding universal stress UspA family protein